MHIGLIGLGRMGRIVGERLTDAGHEVTGFDVDETTRETVDQTTDIAVEETMVDVVNALPEPARIWLMVPAGDAVDETLAGLEPHLSDDAVIVDGGNSHYAMSIGRARALTCGYVDCGTSGGVGGRDRGMALMVGGEPWAVDAVEPAFTAVAGGRRYWEHLGPHGAGHYVKMVHNGVEYALMQAYGEGFELLRHGRYDLDLEAVARNWSGNAVIRSWLVELCEEAFAEEGSDLGDVAARIEGGSTGRWTVEEAISQEIPVPLIYTALAERYASRRERFAHRVANHLRGGFGGHPISRNDG